MRGLISASLALLAGCATMQSTGQSTGEPNDAFLIEVTDRMPGEPYGFVSVSVVEPSRSSDLPPNLTEGQVQEMKEVAGSYGAEVLVIERQETPRRQAFYGLGMRRTDPPSAGVTGLPWCSHEAFPAALAAAKAHADKCLAKARARRSALTGTVRVLLLIDAFGDPYQAAVAPDSTRDGVMGACGLTAAHDTDFGRHHDVLCRAEFRTSL